MRIVTRFDFDGVVSAILLKRKGIIDSWKFVHPKDVQDGLFAPTKEDILTNVPYLEGCGMWFDHHVPRNETKEWTDVKSFENKMEKSTSRVIYDYYGQKESFPNFEDLVDAADKIASGDVTIDDILNPRGWTLVGFLCDSRTGLGRFDFVIGNFELASKLINNCESNIDQIVKLPDIAERIKLYKAHSRLFKEMVRKHTKVYNNVIVTDLRNVDTIYVGNRFIVYYLYPKQNVSLWIVDGKDKQNVVISCGASVINKSSQVDIGKLMEAYDGGGNSNAGGCQVAYERANQIIEDIIENVKEN